MAHNDKTSMMRVKFNSHMPSSTVAALFLKSLHHSKVPTVGWGYFRKRCQGRRLLVGKVLSSKSQASHKRGWRRGGGTDRECMGERRQTGGFKNTKRGGCRESHSSVALAGVPEQSVIPVLPPVFEGSTFSDGLRG